jgi:choline dehydrogenase-like flavoprotein
MATDFARNNMERVKLRPYVLDSEMKIPIGFHSHQMGTTRMSAEPKDGVVDPDCKVFGTTNLYVAGSSVFSTGGGGNPTMPIIQLALRLGEHLMRA